MGYHISVCKPWPGWLDYGAGIFYSFTIGLPSSLLGALLTVATRTLSPRQSAVMSLRISGGLVYLTVAAGSLALWLRSEEQKTSAVAGRGWRRLGEGVIVTGLTVLVMLCSCRHTEPVQLVPGGNAKLGKSAIVAYGCGTCHVIPGIPQPQGLVGPPLTMFARRSYIAGEVPNTAGWLVHWIQAPQSIEPGTAMPNLSVTEQQARNIAAYLYTLK